MSQVKPEADPAQSLRPTLLTSSAAIATLPSERPLRHLNQVDLSRRWTISPRTLERWRWLGEGPPYLKIGGRVAYRMEDVEAFEQARLHQSAAELPSAAARR